MHPVVEAVQNALPPGRGIVAVSGGADSVALVRSLVELGAEVVVAHVNHQLRGVESDGDEEFVRVLASDLNLPFESIRIDIPPDCNLEAYARAERYDWMNSLTGKWITTGHTADDQAETVLFRMIRGTGLAGLRGIPAVESFWGKPRIRPLLKLTRVNVLDYLQSLNQCYRIDSSNNDPRFTRNRIRQELMPLLKTFNSDVVAKINLLAWLAGENTDAIQIEARKFLDLVELPPAGSLVILDVQRARNSNVHPNLAREMFRELWARNRWRSNRMNAGHWMSLANLLLGCGSDVDLPDGYRARQVGTIIQVGPKV